MEMKKYKLGDLIDVSRGKSLAGEFYATSGNLVRLTMGNFDYINNCFKQNTSKDNLFFSGKVEEKFILNAGDIITPLTEQTPGLLGSTARIPESGKYIQSQDVALVRCKKDKLDDGFAYYLISSESVKKQLGAAAQQTKIRHTSPDKIKDCTVYIPEISIQKKIGNILSTLDKRIENLRAQNRVLEQTAMTIYDYTFLQCAGHQTTYNKTLNRNIPADWEVKKLSDMADILSGGTPKTAREDYWNGNIPWLSVKDFNTESTYVLKSERNITKLGLDNCSATLLEENDVVMSARGTVGVMTMVPYAMTFNQSCFGFHAKNISGNSPYFLYYTLKTTVNELVAGSHGSVFNTISRDDLGRVNVAFPDSKSLDKFNAQVEPVFKKQLVNTKQIEALTTQRNSLLPLLMTGQIEVV